MTIDHGRVPGSRASHRANSAVVSTKGFDPARVRVSAADFNGHDWDGSPFDHVPPWLDAALRLGTITIKAGDRDYALWAVETPSGVKVAEPGDDIVCADGHFDVHKDAYLASADRSPEGGDHEDGRHAKHESAVGAAETPNTGRGTSHG